MAIQLKRIQSSIRHTLNSLIPMGSNCALIDFPNYSNVGDSAIWLGEIKYLRGRKCNIKYVCDPGKYNRHALRCAIGTGTILLNGGGNFGDIWTDHQLFREKIIEHFPGNKIIQLPQSIQFDHPDNLIRAKNIFSRHPDFHLVVRDMPSYRVAEKNFSNPVYLCPDMALMLDVPRLSSKPKSTGIVVLSRTDQEKSPSAQPHIPSPRSIKIVDWLDEPVPRLEWLYNWAHKRLSYDSKVPAWILNRLVVHAANHMAKQRLDRGLALIDQGNVLVTDRLHALILGRLGGMQVFFIDNRYGKLGNLVEAWLADDPDLKGCHSFSDALGQASRLLDAGGSSE